MTDLNERIRDLEGALRIKDELIETLRNSQCSCLPAVEAERDRLRRDNAELRRTIQQMESKSP